jgi:hypothetical protein
MSAFADWLSAEAEHGSRREWVRKIDRVTDTRARALLFSRPKPHVSAERPETNAPEPVDLSRVLELAKDQNRTCVCLETADDAHSLKGLRRWIVWIGEPAQNLKHVVSTVEYVATVDPSNPHALARVPRGELYRRVLDATRDAEHISVDQLSLAKALTLGYAPA